ncbi:type I inositol polyphosphate 5-phosphatase 4-like [Salvia splendens]|uniref:type I inositol polyphosphate 5-phosphatase 4-like n=1 Tax=Salvia splendens TaxID=180675 RepID=UPI001C27EE6C|nr:type I inositol polyphosphate 5-phosphatase 4-like [Salvia splendens]XP_042048525.1 type I inositol polyphosphate 5-phosphatase 4-like [Salvia splendens]
MREDGSSKKSKLSWPKTLVKKWFNLQSKDGDFHADEIIYGGVDEEWRNNLPEREQPYTVKKSNTEKLTARNPECMRRNEFEFDSTQITDVQDYRIFVATWNVGGKSPPSYLNLEDWLHTSPPSDIYVLGFQEIVPLNAGNVLGTEDNGPARKWQALIRKTLNSLPASGGGGDGGGGGVVFNTRSTSPYELYDDLKGPNREQDPSFFPRHSVQSVSQSMRMMGSGISVAQPKLDPRFSMCDRVMYGHRPSDYYDQNARWDASSDDEDGPSDSFCAQYYNASVSIEDKDKNPGQSRYCLVASKQMVGILVTVWIKTELRDAVRNLKVSCVGRGLMGYLGNKGSISISMSLHQTSFCFICSHLTSGEKDGDELRRNSDVMEILRKTRFPEVHATTDESKSPQTILDHDRVIWLGDLNYRIALSYRYAKALVEMRNWRALLENDQLRIEQRYGRVFAGWNEGKIYFPPTYKYSNNSDRYAGENMRQKKKRRTPAWCDRILWHGHGLRQLSYVRGESRFSDHRPVCSMFLAEVESTNCGRFKKSTSYSSARVEIEELLPYSHGYDQLYLF